VGILVVLSLAMITVYFRESDDGAVHGIQDSAAQAMRPFQIAADRVASPFGDAYGYFDGLFAAKGENERLRDEIDRLRVLATQNQTAVDENERLKALLDFRDGPTFPQDYAAVSARVTATAPSAFQQQISIAAGTADGVGLDDPVVTRDGLVGSVTRVTSRTAQVTLLTDRASAVSAMDLTSNASGLIRHGQGRAETLFLDRVAKTEVVEKGDVVVTAGTQPGEFPSLYPKGIQIGEVVSVDQTDTEFFKQIQVQPFVDFGTLDAVLVLVEEKQGSGR
jgi:rod shape-determining protein MreC